MLMRILLTGFIIFAPVNYASADSSEAAAYLTQYEIPQPTTSSVVVCHGFGCKYRTSVTLGADDIRSLRRILEKGKGSASAEISAVAEAVSWFERRIGPYTGTNKRTPRAGPDQAGIRSEADCIDESVNTTVLLLLIARLDLLHHHEVDAPQSRGYFIDGRYPHATAVVANLRTGSRWAIDPWTKRNGERPDTLPLDRWMSGS
jgi:hypothetical protein